MDTTTVLQPVSHFVLGTSVTRLRTFCLHGTGHVVPYGVGQVSLNNLVLNHVRENTNG